MPSGEKQEVFGRYNDKLRERICCQELNLNIEFLLKLSNKYSGSCLRRNLSSATS